VRATLAKLTAIVLRRIRLLRQIGIFEWCDHVQHATLVWKCKKKFLEKTVLINRLIHSMCCVFIIIIIIITDNIMAQIRKNAAKTPSRLLPAVCSFSLLKCFNFCLYSNCSRTDSNERKIFKFKIQVIYVGYKCSVHRSVRDILHAVGLMQL